MNKNCAFVVSLTCTSGFSFSRMHIEQKDKVIATQ